IFPEGSRVAVWSLRSELMGVADDQALGAGAGSSEAERDWAAERPAAWMTAAGRGGAVRVDGHEGADRAEGQVVAVFWAAPRVPLLAFQANVRELDCGSMAVTSKVTAWPGETEMADW